jgi:hypothetical protein
MVIKLLRVCLFKRVRGLGIGSLKHFDKHLVCNGDSYLKWNTFNNIPFPFFTFVHYSSLPSEITYQSGIRAMSTQKDRIEKLETDMHEVKDSIQKLAQGNDTKLQDLKESLERSMREIFDGSSKNQGESSRNMTRSQIQDISILITVTTETMATTFDP